MPDPVWSGTATTPTAIDQALRDLHLQHRALESFVPARVINLVAVCKPKNEAAIEQALEHSGRFHPSRLILCALEDVESKLDASAALLCDVTGTGPNSIAVCRERIKLNIGAKQLAALDSVIDPLLLSELPTVVWADSGFGEVFGRLRRLASVALVDSHRDSDPARALDHAAQLAQDTDVVDFAWLRLVAWRERFAGAFSSAAFAGKESEIRKVNINYRDGSLTSALLFTGWLASRLEWKVTPLEPVNNDLVGSANAGSNKIEISLIPESQEGQPGFVSLQIDFSDSMRLTFQRGRGGLRSTRTDADGRSEELVLLGAKHSEATILAEAIRQALIGDQIYKPALIAARNLLK
jgi:glucose-6-phosphate dehydrogenase assembly protein OpcA